MSLTSKITAAIDAQLVGATDHGAPASHVTESYSCDLASGAAAGKADLEFSDQRTVAASSNDDLDLAGGGLTDDLGAAVNFAKVKAIMIKAAAANVNDVVVGAAGTNPFLGPLADATDKIKIAPGGVLLIAAPVGGWAVGAGASDVLRIANGGAGTSVTYDLTLLGTSA